MTLGMGSVDISFYVWCALCADRIAQSLSTCIGCATHIVHITYVIFVGSFQSREGRHGHPQVTSRLSPQNLRQLCTGPARPEYCVTHSPVEQKIGMDARSSLKGRRDDNEHTRCADEKWPIASERRARSKKFCTLGSNVIDARALQTPFFAGASVRS